MRADPEVTLFHSPQTRSTGALMLLEELHAPYTLQLLDLRGRQEQRQPAPASTSPYGDFDTVLSTLLGQLERGPCFLGECFTALDILWGQGLAWILQAAASAADPPVGASGTVSAKN